MTKGILKIIITTYFKPSPSDFSKLRDSQDLILVENGKEFEVDLIGSAVNHHLIIWQQKQYFVCKDYCVFTKSRVFTPLESCYLYLTKTNERDSRGFYLLKLQYFKDGILRKTFNVRSGHPDKQVFRIGLNTLSGCMEPLPEGKWKIEDIYYDANAVVTWGSAGSVVFSSLEEMQEFIEEVLRDKDLQYLYSDWDLGYLAEFFVEPKSDFGS